MDGDGYLRLGIGVGVGVDFVVVRGVAGNQHHIRCRYQHDIYHMIVYICI